MGFSTILYTSTIFGWGLNNPKMAETSVISNIYWLINFKIPSSKSIVAPYVDFIFYSSSKRDFIKILNVQMSYLSFLFE